MSTQFEKDSHVPFPFLFYIFSLLGINNHPANKPHSQCHIQRRQCSCFRRHGQSWLWSLQNQGSPPFPNPCSASYPLDDGNNREPLPFSSHRWGRRRERSMHFPLSDIEQISNQPDPLFDTHRHSRLCFFLHDFLVNSRNIHARSARTDRILAFRYQGFTGGAKSFFSKWIRYCYFFGIISFGITITNYAFFLIPLIFLCRQRYDVGKRAAPFCLINIICLVAIVALSLLQNATWPQCPLFWSSILDSINGIQPYEEFNYISTDFSLSKIYEWIKQLFVYPLIGGTLLESGLISHTQVGDISPITIKLT